MIDLPATPIGFAALPEPLRARIEAELTAGERLLWAAQPDPRRPWGRARTRLSFWIWVGGWGLLGLLCAGGTVPISRTEYAAFGGLLVFIALMAEVVAFLLLVGLVADWFREGKQARQKIRELYALTDRRILVWEPVDRSAAVNVRQYQPGSIEGRQIQRKEYPDGSGDLLFGLHFSASEGLFGIADVRRIDDLVRHVLTEPKPPVPSRFKPDPDDYEEPF